MQNFIKIEIAVPSPAVAEILIADLSEMNFYGFEEEENCLTAYIKEEDFDEEKFNKYAIAKFEFKRSVIPEQNWNQQWEREFQPVIIDDFAAIRATFHKPVKKVKHELIITPKMSFGTGDHATTFLMIAQMEKVNFQDKVVLDFGTGTGILAILAEKLGASSVLAIDNDEWSINNALENVQTNTCKNIYIEKRSDLEGIPAVDIVLANINFNVLTRFAASISFLLKEKSLLLISGFLSEDQESIEKVFGKYDFLQLNMLEKEGWLSLLLEKQQNKV